jgi:hypothetical protein
LTPPMGGHRLVQSLAFRASWRSRGASSRIPAKVAPPVTPSGAKRSSLKNGTRGRRPSLPRCPSIVGRAALSYIVVPPAILRILQPQPQPAPFILLPPILAPAANTGVLVNHGVYEVAATAVTVVATMTTRVAAMRTATAATRWRQCNGGNVTAATRRWRA